MRNLLKKSIAILVFLVFFLPDNHAQKHIGIKTNILHWATASPNLGVEVAFRYKMTLELSGGFNPFTFNDNKQWKHWVIWPEIRYWPWEAFNGHSIGVHGVFAEFDVGGLDIPIKKLESLKDRRVDGNVNGIGLSYGYAWIIGNNLLLEANVGAGYGRLNYDVLTIGEDGYKINEGRKHYFGPTKGAISLVYLF